MAFEIKLYMTGDPPNKIEKTLADVGTISGVLKDSDNILTPSILVEADGIPVFNYAQIPLYSHYYYKMSIDIIKNRLFLINLKHDPLMTWKDQIRGLSGIVEMQQNTGNLYITDPNLAISQKRDIVTKTFPTGFGSATSMVLTCM